MDLSLWVELSYLFSSVLFVVGLKRLQSPATARAGNRLAALAMLIAIVATLVENQAVSWTGIVGGMILGGLIGGVLARTVKMTDMPQLVGPSTGSVEEPRPWWPRPSWFEFRPPGPFSSLATG